MNHLLIPFRLRETRYYIACYTSGSMDQALFLQNGQKQLLMASSAQSLQSAVTEPVEQSWTEIAELHIDQVTEWFDFHIESDGLEQHIRNLWQYFITPMLNTYPNKRVLTNLGYYEPHYSDFVQTCEEGSTIKNLDDVDLLKPLLKKCLVYALRAMPKRTIDAT